MKRGFKYDFTVDLTKSDEEEEVPPSKVKKGGSDSSGFSGHPGGSRDAHRQQQNRRGNDTSPWGRDGLHPSWYGNMGAAAVQWRSQMSNAMEPRGFDRMNFNNSGSPWDNRGNNQFNSFGRGGGRQQRSREDGWSPFGQGRSFDGGGFSDDFLPGPEVFSNPSDQFRRDFTPNPDDFSTIAESLTYNIPAKQIHTGQNWKNLTNSVIRHFDRNQPTLATMMKKIQLWKELYRVIRLEHDCSLFVFGSTFNGFASSGSDIDMCLFMDRIEHYPAKQKLNMVRSLLRKHCRHFIHTNIELVPAKVPILKFSDKVAHLEVDLSVDNENCIRNTHLLYYYSKADYRVRPLVLAVKKWAQRNDINDARNQTLSSFVITLMVLHYLQFAANPFVVPCLQELYPELFSPKADLLSLTYHKKMTFMSMNTDSAGELLVGFFNYFATEFDADNCVGSIRTGSLLTAESCESHAKSNKNSPGQWKARLKMEEPFDQTNAARAVCNDYQFEKIKRAFKRANKTLLSKRGEHITLEDL